MSFKKGFTHTGIFHTDDVMSTALIKLLNPHIAIKRVSEITERMKQEQFIIYDVGSGKYDRHQADVKRDEHGNKYCSFGLLWESFGKEVLEKCGFTQIQNAFHRFRERYVYLMNEVDNGGYENVLNFYENDFILRFRPKWYQDNSDVAWNKAFLKAVEQGEIILKQWLEDVRSDTDMQMEAEKIWLNTPAKEGILFLEKPILWRELNKSKPRKEVRIVIIKNKRNEFAVIPVNFPEDKVMPSHYLYFVYESGFMGSAKSLRLAMKAAKQILKYKKMKNESPLTYLMVEKYEKA